MYFEITRVSSPGEQPCDNVSEAEIKVPSTGGTTITRKAWIIKIDLLEDLVDFIAEHGDIIIREASPDGMNELQIYDYYVE